MNLNQWLDQFSRSEYRENIAYRQTRPAQAADLRDFPDFLHKSLVEVLKKRGIHKLYSHQNLALQHYAAQKDFIVTTPTASGKSLAYLLPVLNDKLSYPNGRHLFLFPTKALAQDQLALFRELKSDIQANWFVSTFDGDTPPEERTKVKQGGDLILSNPDMLHAGILPHHTIWKKFFESLRTIVIDEMHIYLGIFGSQVSNVFRRLNRILAHYGSSPRYIFTSATISNPQELAKNLCGRDFELIEKSGASTGEKHFVFYNPPIIDAEGNRQSPYRSAAIIGSELIANKIPTILFARSRNRVEILYELIAQRLPVHLRSKVQSYRGGYLPLERRNLEQRMRSGDLLGIISTNALELGIDIGSLSAVVSVGYPGRISSLLQQFGRAGRSNEPAAAIMVATSNALDQYLIRNPEFMATSGGEAAVIHPDNLLIFMDHLKCAAFELKFHETDTFGNRPVKEYLEYLADSGVLLKKDSEYFWMQQTYPAGSVSLRSAAQDNFVIVDITRAGQEKVIGEIDYFSAPVMIHDEAVYLHRGRHYFVEQLKWDERRAEVKEIKSDYYTDAHQKTRISVLARDEESQKGVIRSVFGEVTIITKAFLYKKIKITTSENLGWGNIHTPEIEMHTQAAWLELEPALFKDIQETARNALLMRISYLFKTMAPLIALCDRNDLSAEGRYRDPQFSEYAVVFYDRYPGGVGLSYRTVQNIENLILLADDTVTNCPCESGCPSCIGVWSSFEIPVEEEPAPFSEDVLEFPYKKSVIEMLKFILKQYEQH